MATGARRVAVLLRGINVGGNNRLGMAELRRSLEARGYEGVASYIASGNVALDLPQGMSPGAVDDAAVAAAVAAIIREDYGLDIAVIARSHAELAAVVQHNPLADHLDEPAKLMVGFAPRDVPADKVKPVNGSRDEIVVVGRELFLYCPDGLGRAKLPNFDRQTGLPITVRNWNTVLKLAAMTER